MWLSAASSCPYAGVFVLRQPNGGLYLCICNQGNRANSGTCSPLPLSPGQLLIQCMQLSSIFTPYSNLSGYGHLWLFWCSSLVSKQELLWLSVNDSEHKSLTSWTNANPWDMYSLLGIIFWPKEFMLHEPAWSQKSDSEIPSVPALLTICSACSCF